MSKIYSENTRILAAAKQACMMCADMVEGNNLYIRQQFPNFSREKLQL